MSKQQYSESGRHRDERRQHDAAARHAAEQTTEPYNWGLSRRAMTVMGAIAVILIVSLTFLFVAGYIRW